MSHFRQVRTRMKRLDALAKALQSRGYSPIPMLGQKVVSVDECTELRLAPADIKEGNRWEIRFVQEADGFISTRTDTDVFKTGRNVELDLANRAGNGVNQQFENVLIPEYAIEATLLTMAEQGFVCDRGSIKVDGDTIVIVGTKDNTAFSPTATVATSNLIVI